MVLVLGGAASNLEIAGHCWITSAREYPDSIARMTWLRANLKCLHVLRLHVMAPGGKRPWCARLTGQVQGVEVLYDEGSNRSISFPEPCGHPREGMGEASAGAHVGRAIERRKHCHSECRDSHVGRRQHCSHRFGEVREGSAASKNPRTHVRTRSGPGRPPRCPALRAGQPKPRQLPSGG